MSLVPAVAQHHGQHIFAFFGTDHQGLIMQAGVIGMKAWAQHLFAQLFTVEICLVHAKPQDVQPRRFCTRTHRKTFHEHRMHIPPQGRTNGFRLPCLALLGCFKPIPGAPALFVGVRSHKHAPIVACARLKRHGQFPAQVIHAAEDTPRPCVLMHGHKPCVQQAFAAFRIQRHLHAGRQQVRSGTFRNGIAQACARHVKTQGPMEMVHLHSLNSHA